MLWHRQEIFESKGDKSSSSAECKIWSWEVWDTKSPADWMPAHKPTELSGIKQKTWTQQPASMMSEHSAHLISLPIGFRTGLWRYTCLSLLILTLWHRKAIFKSKDKNAGFEAGKSETSNCQQTKFPPTNPLRCRGSSNKLELGTWGYFVIAVYRWMQSKTAYYIRCADSGFAPIQWETSLLSNSVSHWLGTNLELALFSDPKHPEM